MLNSFWGKFGQRENMVQVQYVKDPAVLFNKLASNNSKVTDLNFVSNSMVAMHWRHDEDFAETSGKTNVIVAAYTTAQARLKLYSYLEVLGRRVLYCDTDSVVFYSKKDDLKLPLGDYLGELTDETPGNSIQTFVTGGPKNYAYVLKRPQPDGTKTCSKIRGITLNYKNLMDKSYSHDSIVLTDTSTISRDKFATALLTTRATKVYRIVFDKRVRTDNFGSLPYGF
jgi:hypothetical protein